MDAIKEAFSKKERNSEGMTAFGFRLRNQFSQNKAYRRPKELQWLEDLRAYKGLYDPEVKIEANNSKVYPKITRSKINIVLSRLHEMLFPETDKNWELGPTPEPKLSKETVKQIAMSLIQVNPETQEPVIPSADDLAIAIKKFAKETAEKMSSEIDDQLTEMDYSEETKKVLRSGLMYGTGIMKGPLVGKKTKRRWESTPAGEFEEKVDNEDVPDLKFIRLWDWYPEMTVTDIDKIEGAFERHVMSKHDLRQLAKRSDFYKDMIDKYLLEHPDGDYVHLNWEVDLQTIEVEAGSGGGETPLSSTSASDDSSRSTSRQLGKKYEVLEYWGYVDGQDLTECGIEVEDVELEYAANVWLLGRYPIKAILYDKALDEYKVFYYEKDETSIFGEGLARIMRHSQIAVAAAARMVLDNASCVSGPQVEINWSLMTPDTDLNSFYPRKIWFREGKGVDAQYPALRVYNIESHLDELLKIIDAFKQFGDEETTLPTWMIGQMVNNETAQATSGRLATITVSIKDVVKNFDTFTEKIIRDIYAWNMEFNPRPDIKGDFKCKAKGVSSLVMKEIRMQALAQLTTTMTPEEWDYIPKRDFLQEKFKAHDINIALLSEEEVKKLREARKQSAEMQLAIEMQKAEIAYKRAQTMSQLTKAKKTNTDATIAAQTPIEQPEGSDPRLTEEEIALQQTERGGKEAEIRRSEEAHALEMQHKDESHKMKMATDTTKTAHEVANKDKVVEHGMKIKEKMTQADVKAKGMKKKAEAKPKKAKKE
jgi:hypothetical protein